MPRIVVTGGKGDLAQAIGVEFLSDGWSLENPGRDELDISASWEKIGHWFSRREKTDLLVCAAGMACDELLARASAEIFENSLSINLKGSAACARAALLANSEKSAQIMPESHIIFVGSFSANHPGIGQAAYAAGKAGLEGLTKSLAQEFGPSGIRVNLILPGFLETKMTQNLPEKIRERCKSRHCLARFTTTAQVARFVKFLHCELLSASGQIFNLDSRIL